MKKQLMVILALILTTTMLFIGCSAPAETPETNEPSTEQQDVQSTEPIKIGNIQDLTAFASESGNANTWGVEYAVNMINEQGGINGRQIELITVDCKADVQEGILAYRSLVDEHEVAAIIGPPLSNPALAWVDLSEEDQMPIVGHFMDERCTTDEETGEPHPFMFLAEPGCSQQAYSMAAYAIEELGIKTYATIYNNALSYAVQHALPFAEYVVDHGGEVLEEQTFEGGGDYRAQALKIAQANPEAVFVPNYAADNALIYDQLREAGYEGIILGNNTFSPPFTSLVKNEVYDTYFLQNADMEEEGTLAKELNDMYKEETGSQYPIINVNFGYDAVMVLANALAQVEDPYDGVAVADVLENSTTDVESSSGLITINPETHRTIGLPMLISQYDENFVAQVIHEYTLEEEYE